MKQRKQKILGIRKSFEHAPGQPRPCPCSFFCCVFNARCSKYFLKTQKSGRLKKAGRTRGFSLFGKAVYQRVHLAFGRDFPGFLHNILLLRRRKVRKSLHSVGILRKRKAESQRQFGFIHFKHPCRFLLFFDGKQKLFKKRRRDKITPSIPKLFTLQEPAQEPHFLTEGEPSAGFLLKFFRVVFAPLKIAVKNDYRGDGVNHFLALFAAGVRLVKIPRGGNGGLALVPHSYGHVYPA